MLGVVLCGGQSTRMGTDKGLIKQDGNTYVWAKAAADKLSSLSIPVVISVNPGQYEAYCAVFPSGSIIRDDKNLDLKGPMYGILSVHIQYPAEELFVLACDMPLMESFILKELLAVSLRQSVKDAFVFCSDDEPEPLCGIYTAKGLAKIIQLFQNNELKKMSMKYMLEKLNTLQAPIAIENKKYFQNFNAHAALNGW